MLRWQLANGVQHVRSHVDVCDPRADARCGRWSSCARRSRGLIDLQLVAFPQQGIFGFDGGAALMRKAVELGADVVGGIPHYELTREDGVASVRVRVRRWPTSTGCWSTSTATRPTTTTRGSSR